MLPRFGVSGSLEAFESLTAVGIMAVEYYCYLYEIYFHVTFHADLFNGHYIKSRIMVKKNLNTPSTSSSRGHKHPRGSGRPPGRGFTGHKGRGSARDYTGQGSESIVGVEERPESAVDEPSDEEGSTEGTDTGSTIVYVLTEIVLGEEEDDVEIDVPIAMWVSLFEDTLLEDSPILISSIGFQPL